MPQRIFAASKSSLFAVSGSTELGGGQDPHLPVGGPWNGYTFRSAIQTATDFSGMKRIDSALLHIKTSSAVHVAFSSDPDIYVKRATASWTANSSKSSSDGGSGWSTAATNYPGPSTTTSGQATRDVSASEGVWLDIDISAIVRAWAPASVDGGGGAANYGVVLQYVASGDVTEFNSAESSTPPTIIVNYSTDSPPVVAMDGPSGVQGTTRPTLSGSASDPDGDPITNVHIEVSAGATIVYQVDLGAVPAGAWSHVPTVDLPGGALTARAVSGSTNLASPWSNVVSFTVDRPPVVGAWSSPVGNVGGTRRPVHTFATSDPDGDAITAYDLEVYQSSGGAPVGGAVYAVASSTVGIVAGSVSHTPTVDLPGGPLIARARVRSGPAALWSAWSAYQPYTIVLTAPTIAWIWPDVDGGYLGYAWILDLSGALTSRQPHTRVNVTPPSGQTLADVRVEVRFGAGGWVAWSTWQNVTPGEVAAAFPPDYPTNAVTYGSGRVRWTATASGGGVTVVERAWQASLMETRQAFALGDQVSELQIAYTVKGKGQKQVGNAWDDVFMFARAQTSLDTLAAGAAWRDIQHASELAAIVAELPATNAYLGIRTRYVHREPDANLLTNGSFEQGLTGWATDAGTTYLMIAGGPDGAQYLRIPGDGVTLYPQVRQVVPVIPYGRYRLAGWIGTFEAAANIIIRADDLANGGTTVMSFSRSSSFDAALTYYESAVWQAPANATSLQVLGFIAAAPAASNVDGRFDGIRLLGPVPGAAGLDKLDVTWKSLG